MAIGLSLLLFLPRAAFAQTPDPVAELMQQMTDDEKVGQLFIVAFVGDSADPSSDIARLIKEYKVGGVVLQAVNDNFRNDEDTPLQVANLANGLQALAFGASGRPGIPLFVAVDHEGDGFPYSRVRDGATALPSAMAIGATWRPENAEEAGQITGRELSAMGINMLLGPVVDVLNNPRLTARGDIGVRAFGGDPFWVSKMGRAYIRGVHEGSGGRMAVVAKHFPGHGGSDRLPDREVATVDKSLSELQRVELPPFFAVTQVDSEQSTADALMSSHIRYRGFQGNIRQLTPPISFDPEGMRMILSLPEFAAWRARGGLIVSDSLGVDAVRKYFDPQMRTFPHKRIAREAFLAGNDVLMLGQFALHNVWLDQLSNMEEAIQFFCSEYRANPDFRRRVDESVARILRLKLALYPEFSLQAAQVDPDQAQKQAGQGEETAVRIAREAVTLVFPQSAEELRVRMPSPPRRDEDILIFTDVRDDTRECYAEGCQPFALIPVDAISRTIGALYGPDGLGLIDPARVHSHTFGELKSLLTGQLALGEGTPPLLATLTPDGSPLPPVTPGPEGAPEPAAGPGPTPAVAEAETTARQAELEKQLQEAEWIIFGMLDVNTERSPDSDAVRLFLARGSAALYDKKIVALAFNAPYYLDTTEINKLTAYYAAYNKQPAAIEATVRALFGDFTPTGASPVSIEGANYDLAQALEPDPAQSIPLTLVEPAAGTEVRIPATVRVRAGPILDHNGRPVPDRSPVEFQVFYADLGRVGATTAGDTRDGVAEASLTLDQGGTVEITAGSNAATTSQVVRLSAIALPTATPLQPTATRPVGDTPGEASATRPASETPTPAVVVEGTASGQAGTGPIGAGDLLLALAGVIVAGALAAAAGRPGPATPSGWLRLGLLAVIGGLAGYLVYALAAYAWDGMWTGLRPWTAAVVAFACGVTLASVAGRRSDAPHELPAGR